MKVYSFTEDDLTGVSNDAVDAFLKQLHNLGELDEATFQKFTTKYRLIVVRRGMLGRFMDKILFADTDGPPRYQLVEFK